MSAPIELFCCYTDEDENDLKKLFQQFRALERANLLRIWYDHMLMPGDARENAIDTYLNNAQIILLIVSASFIDSDYCYDNVMPHALARQESGEARVLAVILHPCDWQVTPLKRLLALPTDNLPITLWPNQHSALLNVTEGVKRIAHELQVEALLKAGETLYQAGQFDEALARFDEALELALPRGEPIVPRSILARLYQGKGNVYLNQEPLAETSKDHLTAALKNYEQALHYDDSLLHSYEQKGCTLFYLEQYENALATLEEALKRGSLDQKVGLYKYQTLLKLNRPAEALAFYEESSTKWAFSVEPHQKAAQLFEERGQFEQALAAWENFIALTYPWQGQEYVESDGKAPDGNNPTEVTLHHASDGYLGKTRVLESLERYDEALETYEWAQLWHLDTEQLLLQKALLLEVLGRDQEALHIFDELVQISPEGNQKNVAGPAYFGKQRVYERLAKQAHAQMQASGYMGGYRLFRTLGTYKYIHGYPWQLAFSPDGRFLVGNSYDHLQLWDASTYEELRTLSIDDERYVGLGFARIREFAFGPDGNSLIATTDKTVKCWSIPSGEELRTFTTLTTDDWDINIALSPHSRFLASAVAETIKVWEISSGKVQHVLRDTGPVTNLTFSSDERFLVSTAAETIRLWDLSSGNTRQTFRHTDEYKVRDVSFSLDDYLLASVGEYSLSQESKLWELATGKVLATDQAYSNMTFSSDNRFLAYTFLWNSDIKVRELPSGDHYYSLREHEHSILEHRNSIYTLAFSPDSHFLLGGCSDSTIRLWDISSLKLQQTLYGHTGPVDKLVFSPDGYMLASGSQDGTIKLWLWQ